MEVKIKLSDIKENRIEIDGSVIERAKFVEIKMDRNNKPIVVLELSPDGVDVDLSQ